MSAPDDFEAAVWRTAGRRLDGTDVDQIIAAANAFAASQEQLAAETAYRRSVAEFRAQRAADNQRRIDALLLELVAALAELPLDAGAWPNQYSRHHSAEPDAACLAA